MICFPLDNTNYLADSLGAWFGTRTRGVFSDNQNYTVTSNNNLTVTVSAGLGWLKADTYWGVVVYEKEAQILNIDLADGSLERYDMVCVQLDKNMNQAKIVIKKGAYSQNAVYPAIARNSNYDEIYLAAIKVSAGATKISDSDITDLRLNEDYCGIMRDGVTGIPTEQLYSQWQSWFEENSESAQNTFTDWFNGIKDQLSTDAAGNLQNEIDGLKPYIVNAIVKATVSDASRLGVELSVTEDITLTNGLQILLSTDKDVTVSSFVNFNGSYKITIKDGTVPIYSIDSDTFTLDIEKGTYLYLVYSTERNAFIAQAVSDIAKTSKTNTFTEVNTFSKPINALGKVINFGTEVYPAKIESYSNSLMAIAAGTSSTRAMYLGQLSTAWSLCPVSDGNLFLGLPSQRWSQIYSTTSAISTSDRNQKKDIEALEDDFVLNFVEGLQPKSFKMIDGTSGRTHFGFISQDVEALLKELGKESEDFAGFIKSPKTEQYTEKDNQGNEVIKFREIKGEYLYGLRYEEFIALIFRYTQIKAKEFDERLTALEKGKG